MIEATDSIAVAYISPFEVLAQNRSVWSPAKVQGQRTQGRYMLSCAEQTPARRSQVSCARMAMLPGGQRATPWRTFVQAHWPALVAADFFTTEVWTTRGLVTYDTAFVIELQSRRVQILGRRRIRTKPSSSSVCGLSRTSRTLSYKEGRSWSAIAIRSGVERWSSGS